MWKIGTFSLVYLRTRTVRTNAMKVGRRRPSGHNRRGLGAIRAVCRAWRALKSFFRHEWIIDGFPGFLFKAFICTRYYPPFFEMLVFFAYTRLFDNGMACHNSGFPVQGRDELGVYYQPSLGALRAVCRVSRVRVPCVTRCFLSRTKQKTGRRSNMARVQLWALRTRVRARASLPFFFRLPFVSFFPISLCFYVNVGNFCSSILYQQVHIFMYQRMYLFRTTVSPQLLPSMRRNRFEVDMISSNFGRVCRVSRVDVPCLVRHVFFFQRYYLVTHT